MKRGSTKRNLTADIVVSYAIVIVLSISIYHPQHVKNINRLTSCKGQELQYIQKITFSSPQKVINRKDVVTGSDQFPESFHFFNKTFRDNMEAITQLAATLIGKYFRKLIYQPDYKNGRSKNTDLTQNKLTGI
jgi:hypothetical protein